MFSCVIAERKSRFGIPASIRVVQPRVRLALALAAGAAIASEAARARVSCRRDASGARFERGGAGLTDVRGAGCARVTVDAGCKRREAWPAARGRDRASKKTAEGEEGQGAGASAFHELTCAAFVGGRPAGCGAPQFSVCLC